MATTQEKLQTLLERHTEFRSDLLDTISASEKKLRQAIATKKFGDNAIVKRIRQMYSKNIMEINEILLDKEDLTIDKRLRLFDKRKMYMQFLQMFASAEITIQNIEKWVTEEFVEEADEDE